MTKKKIALVAGAAGFIGTHLTERLITKENYQVIGVDNFVTGSRDNIKHLSVYPEFTFLEHDIKDPMDIKEKVDVIFDMACPASPTDFIPLKIEIIESTLGIYHLLQLAREKQAKFVFSSSSEVYGDALVNPQPEDYTGNVNTTGIRSAYDEGKRFGEAMVMAFHRKYKMDTRIVRIFNTYGERMRANDGRAIPTFINQALKNEDVTVFGDGTQTRSPQYISDLVSGIIKLTNSDITTPTNIGNPDEMTINKLAEKIVNLTNSTSKLTHVPLPQIHDPKVRKPDISKAKSELDWEPKVTFNEGMKKTIEWFKINTKRGDIF
ncbi:GDP-mannose 4,6-dehydratase [Candidatus Microgenomates bacterium]|nr:GDP-mannose 4,6-dehydratase [Candidatus Microgenomates bacterium]